MNILIDPAPAMVLIPRMAWLDRISFTTLLLISLTLGLAPFVPEPHVWEKLKMLFAGQLAKPIDIFDLFMHGTPWVLLVLKMTRMGRLPNRDDG